MCLCVLYFNSVTSHIRREALATYVLVVVCHLELLYFYDSDHIILVPFFVFIAHIIILVIFKNLLVNTLVHICDLEVYFLIVAYTALLA